MCLPRLDLGAQRAAVTDTHTAVGGEMCRDQTSLYFQCLGMEILWMCAQCGSSLSWDFSTLSVFHQQNNKQKTIMILRKIYYGSVVLFAVKKFYGLGRDIISS